MYKKILKLVIIFVLIFSWIFGYPPLYENFWRAGIWQNPQIPPKIQEARAGTVTYDTAATHVWHSPVGVTSVDVECWGGGGAGGGSTSNKDGAGGGGGGAYAKKTGITINDDTNYNVIVGAGGTAVSGAAGGNGGDSYFDAGADILAKAGLGGGATILTGGVGGAGGTGSTGTTTYNGGTGGYGRDDNAGAGGPGGTSAGTGSIGVSGGNPWTSSDALTAPAGGGDGGAGHPGILGDGYPGVAPGGGGGGSAEGNPVIGGNGAVGKCILTWTDPPTSTLSTGTDPGVNTIAPGAVETDVNQFVITTNTGTEPINQVTVNLSTADGLARLSITDSSNVELGFTTSPSAGSNAITITETNAVTDPGTTFKVRVTPKSHADMDAPSGAEYDITAPVTAWNGTGGYTHAGSDDNTNALTIDNLSPGNTTDNSGSAGNAQVTINYTPPAPAAGDLHSVIVLRSTSAVTDNPVEGTTYIVGNTFGAVTVACVDTAVTPSTPDFCVDTDVSNGTAYHYEIFAKDSHGNYATGVVPIGSPFTPLSTSIEIKAQDYTTAVASLTFPAGAPSATVSNPSNDKPDTQIFGGAGTAHPVITLLNNSSGSLIIWYNMVAWSDAVSTEHYVVLAKGAACADDTVINNAVTFGSNQTTGITITNGAGNEKDFYLKIGLSAEVGKTGISDLTILGETP